MNLERELQLLAGEIAWPETPPLAPRAAAAGVAPRRRPGLRRGLALALALLVVGLATAFAVPQSRGAILRFLHLGGVTIERVDRLPAAQERPLGADIGPVVSRAAAEQALGVPLLLPALDPVPPLHLQYGNLVSPLFVEHGEPVQLSELGTSYEGIYKKLAGGSTRTRFVDVDGRQGLWVSGARHVFEFPHVPARLAGNVLIWQRDGLTLRLEGRHLTLHDALGVAHSLRHTKM
jgi:hypothetical protein